MVKSLTFSPLKWAAQSIASRGLYTTAKVAVSMVLDFGFDRWHGTETIQWVDTKALDISSEAKEHIAPYKATKAMPFRRLLRTLNLSRTQTFVDFGSGKGRAMLLAAEYGFQKVIGVEISQELCEVARRNAKIMGYESQIHPVVSDVSTFVIDADQNVLYLYDPFDVVILRRILEQLSASLKKSPRTVWLIYNAPTYHDEVMRVGVFTEYQRHEIGGTEFIVYRNS